MKQLSSTYSAKEVEPRLHNLWNDRGTYVANPQTNSPRFCVMLPPPNVTGVLHMGHALGSTLQDILVRWKKMQGYDVLWVPGTDHAGIATQTVVERKLMREEGKHRTEYGRDDFVKKIFEWKDHSQEKIIEQLKALGCSCDWSRFRFSMDEQCSKAVRTMFKKLFDQDLIYRGDYLVNWDPVTCTALADDEVEYEEKQGHLWTIRYPIEGSELSLFVATTRPETVLGDTALAVHPHDERYSTFVGLHVCHPITHRKIPIIADSYVDPEFGTGVVKITPAHDPNDYQIGLRHNLPMVNILTPNAKINETGAPYTGMTTSEARKAIVDELKRQGNLSSIEPHVHRVGVSYRSKAPIEPMLSKQWYVKVSSIKQVLRSYVETKEVRIFPEGWDHIYFQWIDNLRDWCISRQLWWGHRIPIWYRKDNPEIMICYDGEGTPEEVITHPTDWEQDPDVLDTWFSSGLWPFSTLGWPESTPDLSSYFPNSTLITGNDILFFWVARMIMMSHFAFGKAPFKETFLHGLVYSKSYWRKKDGEGIAYVTHDERKTFDLGKTALPSDVMCKWEKMSKSKGNVIDPKEIIEEYGADAMRFALASSVTTARHIDLDRRKFEESRNFANKVWNGSRFVLMHIAQETVSLKECVASFDPQLLTIEDRWILSRLQATYQALSTHLTHYEFDKATNSAYTFFWDDFCAWWIECSKPALFGKEGLALEKNKKALAGCLLLDALKLLHPFAPFLTEEIFSSLKELFEGFTGEETTFAYLQENLRSLINSPILAESLLPTIAKNLPAYAAEAEEFERLRACITSIRAIRGEMKLPPGSSIDLYIFTEENSSFKKLIHDHERLIQALVKIQTISYQSKVASRPAFGSSGSIEDGEFIIPLPQEQQEQETRRLEKECSKLEVMMEKTKQQLANQDFCKKAPAHVIETLEKNLNQQAKDLTLLRQKLHQNERKDAISSISR